MRKLSDARFMSAKEKEVALKSWERFIRAMAEGKRDENLFRLFSKGLYNHLIQHCSFIAHYDRAGFFQHYFAEPEMTLKFLSQFDGRGPCLSVEYGMDYWVRNGNDVCQEYYDINQEMVGIATAFIPDLVLRMENMAKERDLAQAKALQAKWGCYERRDIQGGIPPDAGHGEGGGQLACQPHGQRE